MEAMLAQFSPVNQALGVFKEGAQGMAEGAMTSFVSAALSGERVGKAFKKQMGDMLIAQGSAAILQGALAMIPFMPSFNPIGGTAYLAQGLLMVGAGKLKMLVWDGPGVWLCQRRLHQGRFVWGRSDTGGMELTSSQWEWLIAGVDWHRLGLQSCVRKYS
jgi:hypothetical protein